MKMTKAMESRGANFPDGEVCTSGLHCFGHFHKARPVGQVQPATGDTDAQDPGLIGNYKESGVGGWGAGS